MTTQQTILDTTDAIIDAIGGSDDPARNNERFAEIAQTTPNAVRNYRTAIRGHFPNDVEMYLRVSKELKRKGLSMSLALWGNPQSQRRTA